LVQDKCATIKSSVKRKF